jgi:Rrf2 family protein
MRISAKAEYACIAMLELAANYNEAQTVRVKAIHEAHGIPQRFLVQILLQLKSAGLVVSLRGALGGYQLARSPEKITLAQVINAIEREPALRPTLVPLPASPTVDAIHGVWQEIQAAEQRVLEKHSLADLVRRTQQGSALSYQI